MSISFITIPSAMNFGALTCRLKNLIRLSHPILNGMACIAGIFLCCLLLDMARHVIFALTIDKHKGAFFDKLYVYAEKRKIMSILKATNTAITNL